MLDFVTRTDSEREHYEREYAELGDPPPLGDPSWRNLLRPTDEVLRERIGDVAGKRVLLLGNGTSTKELSLLDQEPELLIVTDVSHVAIKAVHDRYPLDRVVYAVVDAQDLPLANESVDLVYAYAAVHHLPNVERFVSEAMRVLRPSGRAVLFDNAHSPAWQRTKLTLLRPLMRYFHAQAPPSPEDLRFTVDSGGFREQDLDRIIRAAGGEPWFERSGFVHYLVTRATERLPPQRLMRAVGSNERILRSLIALDRQLGKLPAIRRNQIRLVWGFEKPSASAAQPSPIAPDRSPAPGNQASSDPWQTPRRRLR